MTNREFFEAVISTVENTDLVEHAQNELEKLDKRNEKRRSATEKKRAENEPIKMAILEAIGDKENVLCKTIAEAVQISTQKTSALCRQLVDEEKLIVADIKVKNKGTCKGYTKK